MRVLIDSGASENYVRRQSISLNKRLYDDAIRKSKMHEKVSIRVVDGSTKTTPKVVINLRAKLEDPNDKEDFYLLDLDDRYDLTLGIPWLRKHQPWIDWVTKTIGSSKSPKEQFHYDALVSNDPSTTINSRFEGCPGQPTYGNVLESSTADVQHNSELKVNSTRKKESISVIDVSHERETCIDSMSEEIKVEDSTSTKKSHRDNKFTAVDELICNTCNLHELPLDASQILELPEMEFEEFVREFKECRVRGIVVPQAIDAIELCSTSTMDVEVEETKKSRFNTQGWDALSNSPFYKLL